MWGIDVNKLQKSLKYSMVWYGMVWYDMVLGKFWEHYSSLG